MSSFDGKKTRGKNLTLLSLNNKTVLKFWWKNTEMFVNFHIIDLQHIANFSRICALIIEKYWMGWGKWGFLYLLLCPTGKMLGVSSPDWSVQCAAVVPNVPYKRSWCTVELCLPGPCGIIWCRDLPPSTQCTSPPPPPIRPLGIQSTCSFQEGWASGPIQNLRLKNNAHEYCFCLVLFFWGSEEHFYFSSVCDGGKRTRECCSLFLIQ